MKYKATSYIAFLLEVHPNIKSKFSLNVFQNRVLSTWKTKAWWVPLLWTNVGLEGDIQKKNYHNLKYSSFASSLNVCQNDKSLSYTNKNHFNSRILIATRAWMNVCCPKHNIVRGLEVIMGFSGLGLRDLSNDVTIWCQMSTKDQGRFFIDRFHKEPQTHVQRSSFSYIYIHFLSTPNRSETFQRLALKKTQLFLPLAVESFSRCLPTGDWTRRANI